MKFSAAIILATAIGVSAHPSHQHGHHHAHRSAAVAGREFVMAKKPAPPAPKTTTPAAPPPPATSSAAPKPSPPVAQAAAAVDSSSSSSSASASPPSTGSGAYKPFCNGVSKRATLAQIAYAGNTGAPNQFGCNIMPIDASIASMYDYTLHFVNMGNTPQECVCWNKMGPTGEINGFFKGNQALDFSIPANGDKYLAVEGNSQIGCCCDTGSVPLSPFGQFACTWLEADCGNTSNGGASGFDASSLVPGKYNLKITGMEVCDTEGTCSTIYNGGGGKNAYLPGDEDKDGIGGNVMSPKMALTIKVNN